MKTRVFRRLLAVTSAGLAIGAAGNAAAATISAESVVSAIQRRICFENYWWGRDTFKLGKTATLVVRADNDRAYVWSEDLSVVQGAPRWANYFTVAQQGSQAVVGQSYGFNLAYMTGSPGFEQSRMKVFEGQTETIRIEVPADCRPDRTSLDEPQERVLARIEKSMATFLDSTAQQSGTWYRRKTRIAIARFRAGAPETFVFVPGTGEVFHVALRDDDPIDHEGTDRGAYIIQPENDRRRAIELRKKIELYGVNRDIALRDVVR